MRKLLLVLLLTTTLNAQERVLFIGNSYTAANSLPTMVAALASSTNLSIACSQQTLGGATLYQHAQSNATYSKLASQSWDYVVLQAQSQEPSFPFGQFQWQTLCKWQSGKKAVRCARANRHGDFCPRRP